MTSASNRKPRAGRLKNKNDRGLGIVLDGDGDPQWEQIEEDAAYEINLYFTQQAVDQALESLIGRDAGLYVLADGMGGYNAGEVASSIAVKIVTAQ